MRGASSKTTRYFIDTDRCPRGKDYVMGRVSEKVILVTGAARGMGAAHARLLVSEGARVVVGDIIDADGEALASELGNAAVYVHQNVSEPKSWAMAVAAAVSTFGALHGLVNNAGIASMAPIEQFPLDQWNRTLAVNLTGVFLGMQAALPAIRRSGGGSIVNVSSVEGCEAALAFMLMSPPSSACGVSQSRPRWSARPPACALTRFILGSSPRR